MPSVAVTIHESQFPENVRRDLLASLRSRAVNHKFHYDSVKQTNKWLDLHQQFSPARYDKNCRAIYDQSFRAAAAEIKSKNIYLIGLGCGGGQKDTRLLKLLKASGKRVFYTPCDVSTAMVLTARRAALKVISEADCFPFVCDLATAKNLSDAFFSRPGPQTSGLLPRASRLFTFFGMIPNFEPHDILPKLAAIVRPGDTLLFSANLAPGEISLKSKDLRYEPLNPESSLARPGASSLSPQRGEGLRVRGENYGYPASLSLEVHGRYYAAGVQKVLPQYDNALTRDWLMTFLTDLGIEKTDGNLRFEIETRNGLKRIVANFHFQRSCLVKAEGETFHFKKGQAIRLFFSYRYTPPLITRTLARYKLHIEQQWIAKSGEEAVFLCRVR